MAEASQGQRLPGDVPQLAGSGIEWRAARALMEFLEGIKDMAGAVMGSESLRIGVGSEKGDLLVFDGDVWLPLSPGTDGQVLKADSAEDLGVKWATAAAGGANVVRVTANFGASFGDKVSVAVTGETWVTATSCISGVVVAPTGTDPDEMRLLDFRVVISDLVVGDGFTVTVYSEPEAKGSYEVMVIGA